MQPKKEPDYKLRLQLIGPPEKKLREGLKFKQKSKHVGLRNWQLKRRLPLRHKYRLK